MSRRKSYSGCMDFIEALRLILSMVCGVFKLL